jgi:acyl-CoA reductase-like NAD-dependent aldehyde dehydrogenase
MIAASSTRPDVPVPTAIHHIDGHTVAGQGDAWEVRNPATGAVLAVVRGASPAECDRAIAAARRTFDRGVWRDREAAWRAAVLQRTAERIEARADALATLVVLDNGKTLREAHGDVAAAAAAFRAAAQWCMHPPVSERPPERGVRKEIWREPVGLVAGITPFNAPLAFTALKAAPALAAGNSVVLKPSERAPLVPVAVCEAAQEAGLPPGVLNLIQGDAGVAARLAADPRVDLVSLTGGTAAGTAVMHAAAATIKRLILELGGKSAHIVLADADLEAAIPAVAAGIFRNAGQRCLSGSRLLVEASIAEQVERRIAELADRLVVGDPFDPGTQVGALIDERALEAVDRFVAEAAAGGLRLAAGGRRVDALRPGVFYRPTVLCGASPDSPAAQTEIFGPVLTVLRVANADEAVTVANDSLYGLTAGIWSRDLDRAHAMARRIRAGYIWINTFGAIFGDMPFGGYKRSGLGREAGLAGYEAYTELKSILIDTTGGTTAGRF